MITLSRSTKTWVARSRPCMTACPAAAGSCSRFVDRRVATGKGSPHRVRTLLVTRRRSPAHANTITAGHRPEYSLANSCRACGAHTGSTSQSGHSGPSVRLGRWSGCVYLTDKSPSGHTFLAPSNSSPPRQCGPFRLCAQGHRGALAVRPDAERRTPAYPTSKVTGQSSGGRSVRSSRRLLL